MIPPRLAISALLAAAAALPVQAQAPRTINIPASELPSGVEPGEEPLRTHVRYALGGDGRFVDCAVQRSSGVPSVDEAGCRLLSERARFRPEPGTRRGRLILVWASREADALNPPGAPIAVSIVDEIFDTDYPADALRREHEGMVTYDVDVSRTGVPMRCAVSESSGSEILDRNTCRIVMERSAFIPASNGAGGTARGVFRGRIRWRIQD